MVDSNLERRCISLLGELGILPPKDIVKITPLTGGVASDIAKVETSDGDFCVKFALPKLKVEEDWHAPVHRNAAEYKWLQIATQVSPGYFPKLFGCSLEEHGFAMEFVSGDNVFVWKDALLKRGAVAEEAASVAALLGSIHKNTSHVEFDRTGFDNAGDFEALRLEPYLRFTAGVHPEVAGYLLEMADQIFAADRVLVHGDVSPKNILFRGSDPVLLDAECATMGEAAFDVAFCLNHLVLKAFHAPHLAGGFLNAAQAFEKSYFSCVEWEDPDKLNSRVARLLPMLMLARVDGKSPAEYLETPQKNQVRDFSLAQIKSPTKTLGSLFSSIKEDLIS